MQDEDADYPTACEAGMQQCMWRNTKGIALPTEERVVSDPLEAACSIESLYTYYSLSMLSLLGLQFIATSGTWFLAFGTVFLPCLQRFLQGSVG